MREEIIFVANKFPEYRIEFFNKLGKIKNIKFLFTDEKERHSKLKINYKILKGIRLKKFNFHPKLIRELKTAKMVVFLPTDFSHLIDNFLMYTYCRIKKIPYVIWTERWEYKQIPLKDKLAHVFYKKVLKNSYKVIVPGKKAFDYHLKLGVKKENISFAPNASKINFDKSKLKEEIANLKKKYNLGNKKVILYIGRVISRKGLKYLVEGFSKLKNKNAVLMIVGGEDFYKLGEKTVLDELKQQAKELKLGNKAIFTGHIDHNLVAPYYYLASVFVYPSITEKMGDPWGLSLNEALQFGLPIISTDAVASAYDLIKNGENGFMVKEKDSDAIKEALEKILGKEFNKNYSQVSKNLINNKFNYDKMVEGFKKVLK